MEVEVEPLSPQIHEGSITGDDRWCLLQGLVHVDGPVVTGNLVGELLKEMTEL